MVTGTGPKARCDEGHLEATWRLGQGRVSLGGARRSLPDDPPDYFPEAGNLPPDSLLTADMAEGYL